jgi:hypothetical protein
MLMVSGLVLSENNHCPIPGNKFFFIDENDNLHWPKLFYDLVEYMPESSGPINLFQFYGAAYNYTGNNKITCAYALQFNGGVPGYIILQYRHSIKSSNTNKWNNVSSIMRECTSSGANPLDCCW